MPRLVFQQKAESQWLLLLGIFGMHYAEGGQVHLKAQVQYRKTRLSRLHIALRRQLTYFRCFEAHQAAHSCVLYGGEPAHKAVQSIPRAAWQSVHYKCL